MQSINLSEIENAGFWQVLAEHRRAIATHDLIAAGRALDEIEGFARCSGRGSMRKTAGAMLDRNRPGWRESEDDGSESQPQADGPSYSIRDLTGDMLEIRVVLPRGAKHGLRRAFCDAAGYPAD